MTKSEPHLAEGRLWTGDRELPMLMTTAQVAEMVQVNRSTLSRWRATGTGPRVLWLSPSMPRYRRADVADWLRRSAA